MPNEPRYITAYGEYVFSNTTRMLRERGGAYTYKELAVLLGLKVTPNFRRRIKQMVAQGLVTLTPTFTPRGGLENRFSYPEDQTQEIPF